MLGVKKLFFEGIIMIKDKEKKERKTVDKRILYTKKVLKAALLNELKNTPYEKIGIVKLCDSAQISRSAFYLHYEGLDDLLTELVIEALRDNPIIVKYILGEYGTGKISAESGQLSPDIEKYNVLLYDMRSLRIIMDIIASMYKDKFMSDIMEKKGIPKDEAEMIFYYQMSGMIFTASELGADSLERIKEIRKFSDKIFK